MEFSQASPHGALGDQDIFIYVEVPIYGLEDRFQDPNLEDTIMDVDQEALVIQDIPMDVEVPIYGLKDRFQDPNLEDTIMDVDQVPIYGLEDRFQNLNLEDTIMDVDQIPVDLHADPSEPIQKFRTETSDCPDSSFFLPSHHPIQLNP